MPRRTRTAYPEIQVRFGRRVQELREALELTREDLAELAELSPQNIAKIESGERFVTANSLGRLAEALKINLPELFAFERSEAGPTGRPKAASRRRLETLWQLLQSQTESKVDLVHDLAIRVIKD